jgi:hypothetical protein
MAAEEDGTQEQRAQQIVRRGNRQPAYPLDIADDGPGQKPSTFTGGQPARDWDIAAVQLRPENFSPKMVEKAGRLYHLDYRARGDQCFEVASESSDEWYTVRVWGSLIWLATCTCPARPGRWNRAGACAHRALGGYLRAQILGRPIPRWPFMTLEESAS